RRPWPSVVLPPGQDQTTGQHGLQDAVVEEGAPDLEIAALQALQPADDLLEADQVALRDRGLQLLDRGKAVAARLRGESDAAADRKEPLAERADRLVAGRAGGHAVQ